MISYYAGANNEEEEEEEVGFPVYRGLYYSYRG